MRTEAQASKTTQTIEDKRFILRNKKASPTGLARNCFLRFAVSNSR